MPKFSTKTTHKRIIKGRQPRQDFVWGWDSTSQFYSSKILTRKIVWQKGGKRTKNWEKTGKIEKFQKISKFFEDIDLHFRLPITKPTRLFFFVGELLKTVKIAKKNNQKTVKKGPQKSIGPIFYDPSPPSCDG